MRLVPVVIAFAVLLAAGPAGAVDRLVDDNLLPCVSGGLPLHGTISDAVAAAAPGETILVCAGSYADNVLVNKSNLTLRAQGIVLVTPADPGSFGFMVGADDVTIQGFDLSGYSGGVSLSLNCGVVVDADRADVRTNRVHDSFGGICVVGGTDARIRYNVAEANGVGVAFEGAAGEASNNTLANKNFDITASGCTGSVTIDRNSAGGKAGIFAVLCDGVMITNNTVRISASPPAHGIVVSSSQNAVVTRNTVQHADRGINVTGSDGATVSFNSLTFNDVGLDLQSTTGATVTRNNASRNASVDCRWDQTGANVLASNNCVVQDPPGAFE